MAWNTVSDSEMEAGKPARASVIKRIYDDILAVAAGLAGAPKIQTDALDEDIVTEAKMALDSVGSDQIISGALELGGFKAPTSGTTYNLITFVGSTWHESPYTTETDMWRFRALVGGTVTIESNQRRSNSGTGYLRIEKNGALVQQWTATSFTTIARSIDVSLVAGDVVSIMHWHSSGGGNDSELQNLVVKSGTDSPALVPNCYYGE